MSFGQSFFPKALVAALLVLESVFIQAQAGLFFFHSYPQREFSSPAVIPRGSFLLPQLSPEEVFFLLALPRRQASSRERACALPAPLILPTTIAVLFSKV